MSEYFLGWTEDPAILAIVEEVAMTEDKEILSNRKDGGVHRVWVWPLGHYDDVCDDGGPVDEPIWSRVDICTGRYISQGCTFLVWEDEQCRAGTLEDAVWLRKGVNEETIRTRIRAADHERREERERQQRERGISPGGVDFAALLRFGVKP